MDAEPDLGADLQPGQPHEHLERVDDPAVGRVLQRHDAELDVPAVDLLEDRGDRADGDVLDRLAEIWRPKRDDCSCTSAPGRRPARGVARPGCCSSARGRSAGASRRASAPGWRQGAGRSPRPPAPATRFPALASASPGRSGARSRRGDSGASRAPCRSDRSRPGDSPGTDVRFASAAVGAGLGDEARESGGLRGIGPLGAKTGPRGPGVHSDATTGVISGYKNRKRLSSQFSRDRDPACFPGLSNRVK